VVFILAQGNDKFCDKQYTSSPKYRTARVAHRLCWYFRAN